MSFLEHKYMQPREEDRPVAVEISENMLRVSLLDGRVIATPLDWYPRLVEASETQRANVELGLTGIHWPDLDEDLSVQGMLKGSKPSPPQTRRKEHA
jgi:hypothetical protein